jgi:hypothetical protein
LKANFELLTDSSYLPMIEVPKVRGGWGVEI